MTISLETPTLTLKHEFNNIDFETPPTLLPNTSH